MNPSKKSALDKLSVEAWKCVSVKPPECYWPDCGCDPYATKVLADDDDNKNPTRAWAVRMDGQFFSLWLTEKSAKTVLDSYRRQTKAKWDIVPVEVTLCSQGTVDDPR